MEPAHLIQLCRDFDLGHVISIEEDHGGVLNWNYILCTERGKYFIKSVREKRKEDVPYIAEVEEFMAAHGIPAVCMLRTCSGEKFVHYDAHTYTVYPFIESIRTHTYDLSDFEQMGSVLGNIHRAGSSGVPASLQVKNFTDRSADEVIHKLKNYREHILQKTPDVTDQLFLEYIELKLANLNDGEHLGTLPKDTLVHGDYHARNLLFNTRKEIIGVCDWEKAEMNARAYELARSLLYICFHGADIEAPHLFDEEAAMKAAHAFIRGYTTVYPLANEEMRIGLQLRVRKLSLSFWIEDHYYKGNDVRANKFIKHEMRIIRDFTDPARIQRILEGNRIMPL